MKQKHITLAPGVSIKVEYGTNSANTVTEWGTFRIGIVPRNSGFVADTIFQGPKSGAKPESKSSQVVRNFEMALVEADRQLGDGTLPYDIVDELIKCIENARREPNPGKQLIQMQRDFAQDIDGSRSINL